LPVYLLEQGASDLHMVLWCYCHYIWSMVICKT